MPIIKGSTPTMRTVISDTEVDYDNISKIVVTFAQKDTVIPDPDNHFVFTGSGIVHDTVNHVITCAYKVNQAWTLALKEDEDLVSQVDVLMTNGDRKISKEFRIGVCKALKDSQLT